MGNRLAQALLKPINTTGIIILGVYTVIWGVWLALPFWNVFDTAPLFDAMAVFAPEWAWGIFACVVGGIVIYGALKQSYRTLTRGAWCAGWHWAVIAVFYFVADWHNTGGITSLMIAVYGTFVYLNVRVNKVTNKHKEGGSNE